MQPGIADRTANGHNMGWRVHAGLPRYVHGCLCGAVKVVQLHTQLFCLRQGIPPRHQFARQGLAAGKHIAQRMQLAHLLRVGLQMIQKSP